MSRGTLQNRRSRYEKRTEQIFCTDRKNGPKIDPHVSNLRFYWFRFRGVQIHPEWVKRSITHISNKIDLLTKLVWGALFQLCFGILAWPLPFSLEVLKSGQSLPKNLIATTRELGLGQITWWIVMTKKNHRNREIIVEWTVRFVGE